MRVRFWGTRGSIATPGPTTVHYGGNTSCVELTTNAGEHLIFDCGTGARPLGSDLTARSLKPIHASLLIGHTHWDHIQGFPFFAPAFVPGNKLDVYAPEGGQGSLQKILAGQMEHTYFPVELAELPASISYFDLGEGSFKIGDVKITSQYLNHPAITLGYRVECDNAVVVYITDHEPFAETLWRKGSEPGKIESILHEGDRRHANFMARADLVIHDAQYTPAEYPAKKNWGHSTYEYVVEMAAAAGVQRVALTHHDPNHDDAFVKEIEEDARRVAKRRGAKLKVLCAYEGCTINLGAGKGRKSVTATDAVSSSTSTSGLRILLVDDDNTLRKLTQAALRREGYAVIEAVGGEEALKQIEREIPDLIILDFMMPDLNGIEVLKALRSTPRTARLPVIMLTGMGDEESLREAFDAGATDYLSKPFSTPQLTARIRACLSRSANQ
ncbi:MAG: response regulator [Rubrivivax sp.]|nr:response regulator [Pyrinomonadaceae bacterium]